MFYHCHHRNGQDEVDVYITCTLTSSCFIRYYLLYITILIADARLLNLGKVRDHLRNSRSKQSGIDVAIALDHDVSIGPIKDRQAPSVAKSSSATLSVARGKDAKAEASADAFSTGGRFVVSRNKGSAMTAKGGTSVVVTGAENRVHGANSEGYVNNYVSAMGPGGYQPVAAETSSKLGSIPGGCESRDCGY